jgi:hypothetical protein
MHSLPDPHLSSSLMSTRSSSPGGLLRTPTLIGGVSSTFETFPTYLTFHIGHEYHGDYQPPPRLMLSGHLEASPDLDCPRASQIVLLSWQTRDKTGVNASEFVSPKFTSPPQCLPQCPPQEGHKESITACARCCGHQCWLRINLVCVFKRLESSKLAVYPLMSSGAGDGWRENSLNTRELLLQNSKDH